MEYDRDQRTDSASKGCHDHSKYPETTFVLLFLASPSMRNAPCTYSCELRIHARLA
jgi:hypothetical protein